MSLYKDSRGKLRCARRSLLLRALHHQWRFSRALSDHAGELSISQPSFEAESNFVRLNRDQIAFLRHKIDREIVVLTPDNHKLHCRAVWSALLKLDRHMPGITLHLVIAFPLAFEFLRHCCVLRRMLALRRSSFVQRRLCSVSTLFKVAGHLAVLINLQFEVNAEGAFHGKTNIPSFHFDVS